VSLSLVGDFDALGDGEPEGFEVGIRRAGVGDEFEVGDAQCSQYLRTSPVFDHFWGEGFDDGVFLVVLVWAGEAVGEGIAHAVGSEVDDRAATVVLDHLHGFTECVAGGVPGGGRSEFVKNIT